MNLSQFADHLDGLHSLSLIVCVKLFKKLGVSQFMVSLDFLLLLLEDLSLVHGVFLS